MPLPKRRHSSARQAKRRTHYKLSHNLAVGECPRCHAARLSHHVCPSCGYYNGRQWVTPKAERAGEGA